MSAAPSPYEARVRAWSSTERWRVEAAALLDALDLQHGADVLDVGMGSGSLRPLMESRALRHFGLDRWEGWSARADCGTGCVQADAARLPFANATFDAVILHHVFAHLSDADVALGEARRVLRRGGRLGIATPNAAWLRTMAIPSFLAGYRKDPTVMRHVTLRSLVSRVTLAEFRVVEACSWGRMPPLLPWPGLRERLLLVAEAA